MLCVILACYSCDAEKTKIGQIFVDCLGEQMGCGSVFTKFYCPSLPLLRSSFLPLPVPCMWGWLLRWEGETYSPYQLILCSWPVIIHAPHLESLVPSLFLSCSYCQIPHSWPLMLHSRQVKIPSAFCDVLVHYVMWYWHSYQLTNDLPSYFSILDNPPKSKKNP